LPTEPADLADQARAFAGDIGDLLNGTVAHGVRLGAVIAHRRATTVHVGRGLTKRNLLPQTIPLTLGQKPPIAHLYVAYILELDPEGRHLAVSKSQYGIYLDDEQRDVLVHWDYERDPVNPYPQAHIQVNGESPLFDALIKRAGAIARPLRDFHFPVGGRRFRPSLEDVIEFLVLEGLVEKRETWREVVDEHRDRWERRQLQAAVRRDPDSAITQLREDGVLS
jgi:hypothetical protein